MMNQVNIQPMTPDDVDAVFLIERRNHEPYSWSKAQFTGCFAPHYVSWVAKESDNNVVGFIIFQLAYDEATLLLMGVDATYQNQGIGASLLSFSLKYIQQLSREPLISFVHLEVRVSNKYAQRLYFNAGFNEVGVRKGYYPAMNGKEDALLMSLSL